MVSLGGEGNREIERGVLGGKAPHRNVASGRGGDANAIREGHAPTAA